MTGTEASGGPKPVALSVVVPSVNGLGDLVGCLEALERERAGIELEILVADRLGARVRDEVSARFPQVRIVEAPAATTIPRLRALAIESARGEVVAVIEDHVVVPPGWAGRLLEAIREGAEVVGGSVENAATERLVDWSAFLCEYSAALPPLPAGPSASLVGNNVAYRKAVLDRHRATIREGRWENHLHDAIRGAGTELICRPEIVVGHKKHYTIAEYVSQRYLYARSYAGQRVEGAPLWKRVAYGAAALLLPPVLFYRTAARVLAKGRHGGLLLRASPLIALFVVAWAAGEVVGSWFGAGDSLSRVR